VFTNQEKFSIM